MATNNPKGVMFQYFEWNCRTDGSLWRELAERAIEIKNLGTTAVWMPPAYKGMGGRNDTGYAPYDLYDLGEFDQKGSVATKYGTKDEFLAAVKAVQAAGMDAYADVVLDHRMGGDETEEVEVVEVSGDDRNRVIGKPYKIKAFAKYNFPGRGDRYSVFKWRAEHFVAFGYDDNDKGSGGKIFRSVNKEFSGEVSREHGNFDYLMGAEVDQYHPDVRKEELEWAKWFIETTNIDGFRLDAVKHISSSFYADFFQKLRSHFKGREIFAVGEYWSGSIDDLRSYIDRTRGMARLFDVPLHYRLCEVSKVGRDFDLSKIFDNTLVKENPLMAVTFVDNHDSQPGQSLESWVADWFKPLAYALILLRHYGYPCLFYGDYFGSSDRNGNNKLTCHRKIMDDFIQARQKHCFGELHDYFDHPQCIGWMWTGDADHPSALVVLMSTGDAGFKKITTGKRHTTFRDLTGHWPEPVTTDENGEADFRCPPGNVSVWCSLQS